MMSLLGSLARRVGHYYASLLALLFSLSYENKHRREEEILSISGIVGRKYESYIRANQAIVAIETLSCRRVEGCA